MATWRRHKVFLQAMPGMKLSTLFRVLCRNRFRVNLRYLDRLGYLFVLGVYNSYVELFEKACILYQLEGIRIQDPLVFVIGHWRSGTTHLLNLLSFDEQVTCPTVYQTSFPHHFVYSRPWGSKIMDYFAPPKRPMDNMTISAQALHEEEFATAALSGVSPYLRFWFPVTGDDPYSSLDPLRLPPEALKEWKAGLLLFLEKLTFAKGGKRIILKSPPHMGRVRVLLEMFPRAKFVHIVRNPYEVYLSTKKLWQNALYYSHLQVPDPAIIDELIFSWYTELFFLFERDRGLIPAGSLYELKLEDLEERPREILEDLYEKLGLPGFDRYWDRVSGYLKSIADYRKDRYHLDEETRQKVSRRWRETFERYGYSLDPPS